MAEQHHVWEQLDSDTATSYHRFYTYYLTQEPPRSVDRAYQMWRASEGKPAGSKGAPGGWRNWAGAYEKGTGRRLDGVPTWSQRATAYDEYRRELAEAARLQAYTEERQAVIKRLGVMANNGLDVIDDAMVNWKKKAKTDPDLTLAQLATFIRVISGELRELYDVAATRHLELERREGTPPIMELVQPAPAGELLEILQVLAAAGVITAPDGDAGDELMVEPGA